MNRHRILKELRRYPRARTKMDILCARRTREGLLETFVSPAVNISQGGMFLPTDEPVSPGTVVDVQFKLSRIISMFRIKAEVAWRRADEAVTGMGLSFKDLEPENNTMIEHYVLNHFDFKPAVKKKK